MSDEIDINWSTSHHGWSFAKIILDCTVYVACYIFWAQYVCYVLCSQVTGSLDTSIIVWNTNSAMSSIKVTGKQTLK